MNTKTKEKETKALKDSSSKSDSSKKVSTFKKKKKVNKNISTGIAYVYSSFNNTIISIADDSGNVISWSSPGSGRETALRSLQSKGFKIISIKDTTPMPHNGARPPKKRRV